MKSMTIVRGANAKTCAAPFSNCRITYRALSVAVNRCSPPFTVCIGGGIDLICCADMRYCSSDAQFSIKEIDMGMTADVSTLQRLPRLIGDGMVRELAYTGRKFRAEKARSLGLVNRVLGIGI